MTILYNEGVRAFLKGILDNSYDKHIEMDDPIHSDTLLIGAHILAVDGVITVSEQNKFQELLDEVAKIKSDIDD